MRTKPRESDPTRMLAGVLVLVTIVVVTTLAAVVRWLW